MSPKPPSIPLEPFWIFSKIRGDICKLMFISGVNDTGKKFIAGDVDTGEQFIFPRCRWYRSEKKPKSLKFIAGVNDTAEKLFTGVNDTADKFFAGVSCFCQY
jgi:hypothetical protein